MWASNTRLFRDGDANLQSAAADSSFPKEPFCEDEHKTLSVTFGDSSPKVRAK